MYNKPESVGNMTDEQDDNTTTTKQKRQNTTNDTRKELGRGHCEGREEEKRER